MPTYDPVATTGATVELASEALLRGDVEASRARLAASIARSFSAICFFGSESALVSDAW